MTSAPSLPPESLEKVLAAAEAAGVDRERLAAEAGIDLSRAAAGIGFEALAGVYEAAARLTGDSAFGLHVGERTAPRSYGLLGHLVANSGTLGEAMSNLTSYQDIWSRAAGFAAEHGRGRLRLHYWQSEALHPERRRQESEQMLCALITAIRSAVGFAVVPAEVRFEHSAPADSSEHDRIFGCRARFGARTTGLTLERPMLDLPLPEADANLARLVRKQAEFELGGSVSGSLWMRRLQSLVAGALMASGDLSLAAAARASGVGPRTLQRWLRSEGRSWRDLIDETRVALARRLLEERRLSLAEIAFRLGYSQPSAFHRAFRRQTGTTPRAFRRSLEPVSPAASAPPRS
jgi:AraC-like DNA-binding protein